MNFIFLAPRFHTNHFFLTKKLILDGHKVFYFVEKTIGISNKKYINPIKISYSKLGLPIIDVKNYNFNSSNSVVIIRDPFYFKTLIYLFYFKSYKKIFYSQVDAGRQTLFNKVVINFYTNFFSAKWMTPVNSGNKKLFKKLIYFPFVAEIKNKPKKKLKSNIFKFISIGKAQERKNLFFLINAFIKVYRQDKRSRLTLITSYHDQQGLSIYNKIKSIIIKNRLSKIIDLYVNIPHKESRQLIDRSDVFILPARNEIASISIIEAFSSNLPVIVASDCGNAHYVKHLLTGYIFKSNDIDDLINSMIFFLKLSSDHIYKIKTNIFSISKTEFDVSRVPELVNMLK